MIMRAIFIALAIALVIAAVWCVLWFFSSASLACQACDCTYNFFHEIPRCRQPSYAMIGALLATVGGIVFAVLAIRCKPSMMHAPRTPIAAAFIEWVVGAAAFGGVMAFTVGWSGFLGALFVGVLGFLAHAAVIYFNES